MLTLDQVKQLESRVRKAVELIDTLREENTILKDRLGKSDRRLKELENLVEGFRDDQDQIEQGIKDILNQLNTLEDDLHNEKIQPNQVSNHSEVRESPAETINSVQQEIPDTPDRSVPLPSIQEDETAELQDDEGEQAGQLDIF